MHSGNVTIKRKAVKHFESLKRRIECKEWIEKITDIELRSADEFEKDIRDGLILIKLFQKIQPDLVDSTKVHYNCKTISNTEDTFKMIENISIFINAAIKYGAFNDKMSFNPIDLINGNNIDGLLVCLLALKKKSLLDEPKTGLIDSYKVKDNICIICKKPTNKTTKNGLIYYHSNCISCSKCGKYFINEHQKGWFWKQRFYCMSCITTEAKFN
jgi:hypothetical protein